MALSPERIVETAQRLLVEYGLQDVSMRRLAGELGVRPGALYYHVPNKQSLLVQVARRLLEPLSSHEGPIEALMGQLREAVLPLQDGGDLMLIAYALDQQLPPAASLEALLAEEGRPQKEVRRTAALLLRFAFGNIAVEQNQTLLTGADVGSSGSAAALYQDGVRLLLCRPR